MLVGGPLGDVRILDPVTALPQARLSGAEPRGLTAVFGLPDGSVGALDEWGAVSLLGEPAPAPGAVASGLLALVDPATADVGKDLRDVVAAFPADVPGGARLTAACALPDGVAFGDDLGRVHLLVQGGRFSAPRHPAPSRGAG